MAQGSEKNILFSGYYGFDNSGDDAILYSMIQEIRAIDPNLKLNVLSYNPSRTRKFYDVDATQRFHFPRVREAIGSADLLISGGGSLLQDETSSRSLYYYLGIMKMAKAMGKKVYVYANGVGPIHRPLNKKITGRILNSVDMITLRDELSLKVVESLGVQGVPMEVTADPVYGMKSISRDKVLEILRAEGIHPREDYMGISVRAWKKTPDLAEKLARTLDRAYVALRKPILFIPLHYPEDVHFSDKVQGAMVHRNHTGVIRGSYNVREIQGLVGFVELIVGMRLHSLIYAVTEKTPAVGMVYDPKVQAHVHQMGMEEYVDVEDWTEDQLLANILTVAQNKDFLKRQLERTHREVLEQSKRNVTYVFNLLDE
ncbi:MAG: polysaccharide pyruvyl transferase CsaB [Tissierellia bacterium]|nr:polysaccharide pyruvyl transferase CsaB [Tissierellia bacterium]